MARRSKPLDRYEEKRDFGRTPEPAPGAVRAASSARFVVHRHDARNLHFDLRLEIGGVLCSWAIPKGFSYDPRDKRLAVRTEDHPIEYLTFDGVIPPGEYGAGMMTIWDAGEVEPVDAAYYGAAGLELGEIKVVLRGRRLRGEWHLVRTSRGPEGRGAQGAGDDAQRHWLAFKSKDRYAGPKRDSAWGVSLEGAPRKALPRSLRAMTARDEGEPFDDVEWLFEMEFAGRRAFAEWHGGKARVRGMRRCPQSVADGLSTLRAESALLDGVLVALDEHGRPDAALLAEQLTARGANDDVVFYAFDVVHLDGFDLRGLPLTVRKAALRTLVVGEAGVMFVDHVIGEGVALAEAVSGAGLRGMIAKRAASAYRAGVSEDWLRVPVEPSRDATRPIVAPTSMRASAITNPDKVLFPVDGITKRELIAYYEDVADVLVPYLAERPVHMLRYPDGIEAEGFYQHKAPDSPPDWLDTIAIPRSSREGEVVHAVCNSRRALVYLVNLGSIDLHPWLSRIQHLDAPDLALFDLDPKGAPMSDVVTIARVLGEELRAVGLRPCVKTSGKTGLHIVVPVAPITGSDVRLDFDQVRMFCEAVARRVCRLLPDIATVERQVSQRGGRVYVDVQQIRRGQTIVPPYIVRPVLGASVSTPLHWDEVVTDLDPARYTRDVVRARLAEHGDLFASVLDNPQDLVPAIAAFDQRLRGA